MSLMGAASLTRELPHQPATHPPFQLSNNIAHFALWILLAYWSKVPRGFCTSNLVFQGTLLTDLWAGHPTFQLHQHCTVWKLKIARSKSPKDLDYLLLYSKCSFTLLGPRGGHIVPPLSHICVWLCKYAYERDEKLDFSQLWVWKRAVPHEIISFQRKK